MDVREIAVRRHLVWKHVDNAVWLQLLSNAGVSRSQPPNYNTLQPPSYMPETDFELHAVTSSVHVDDVDAHIRRTVKASFAQWRGIWGQVIIRGQHTSFQSRTLILQSTAGIVIPWKKQRKLSANFHTRAIPPMSWRKPLVIWEMVSLVFFKV